MLVLSRRLNEKIMVPGVNMSVQVIGITAKSVRLGIDAPAGLAIYREEVMDRMSSQEVQVALPPALVESPLLREIRHEMRNRLNGATIGLALLRRQLQEKMAEAAEATTDQIGKELQLLQQQVEALSEKTQPKPPVQKAKAKKALLVEDDQNERGLLAGFLRIAGIDVITAGDGADALDYLYTHEHPDVVLMDMVMPHCDGPTTVRKLRSDPACNGLKIFGVSGHPPEQFSLASGTAGIDRWFQKPIDAEKLLIELNRELSLSA